MRPGWVLMEQICQALGLPTDSLIGLRVDAWDPNDAIVVTTQYLVGVVDGEAQIKEQRWVPEPDPVSRAMPNFDPDGTLVTDWARRAEHEALREIGIES